MSEHRTHFQVTTADAELSAELSGRLRNAADQRSDLPGVGDFVAVRPSLADGPATVEAVLPRTSALIRQASGENRPQLIASNVDVVFIVTGLDGDYNLARIGRFLALVHESRAEPVIVANKVDVADDLASQLAGLRDLAPGVALEAINARSGSGVEAIEAYFKGDRTVALVGSSGAGKSTLTNRLLGYDAQATQDVRDHDSRGRHTTTHRQLFVRRKGGCLIDTPGMRGLESWGPTERPSDDFSDIAALAGECRFRDCAHATEPGCAVRAAISSGALDPARLTAYTAAHPRRR